MQITNSEIDKGNAFDWGRTSELYAKFRDVYPEIFYQKIISRGIGVRNQKVLDLGIGTGVLPRNLYASSKKLILQYHPDWTGAIASQFELVSHEEFNVRSPFTRDSWRGRMQACRGVEASLPENTFTE